MKLEAIRSFLKLVEAGSYALAAEESYMSPTTLHSHVKALQSELNTTLVVFDGRRLDLTAAGEQFLMFATRTVNDYDSLCAAMQDMSRPPRTRLRISGMSGPSVHFAPAVISAFHAAHPDVTVTMETSAPGNAIAALTTHQVDVAFVYGGHAAGHDESIAVVPVYHDQLSAIIRRDLYVAPDIGLFETYPVAALPRTASRETLERWARSLGITINVAFEYSSADAILSHVLVGNCIGVIGGYISENSLAKDAVRRLELPGFREDRTVVAMYRKKTTETVADFVQLCTEFYATSAPVPALAAEG